MKKNGFTLIELMVVIAILGILAVLILPNINKIRKNVEQKAYDDKVIQIQSAAIEWAYDNLEKIPLERDGSNLYTKCTFIIIGDLIRLNYIKGDSNNRNALINPIDNTEMNSQKVCVKYTFKENKFDQRTLTAELISN